MVRSIGVFNPSVNAFAASSENLNPTTIATLQPAELQAPLFQRDGLGDTTSFRADFSQIQPFNTFTATPTASTSMGLGQSISQNPFINGFSGNSTATALNSNNSANVLSASQPAGLSSQQRQLQSSLAKLLDFTNTILASVTKTNPNATPSAQAGMQQVISNQAFQQSPMDTSTASSSSSASDGSGESSDDSASNSDPNDMQTANMQSEQCEGGQQEKKGDCQEQKDCKDGGEAQCAGSGEGQNQDTGANANGGDMRSSDGQSDMMQV